MDVLLLDIRLGKETGFELLERHRDAGRRPAVVVLTAFAHAEYAAAALRLGAAALVSRPRRCRSSWRPSGRPRRRARRRVRPPPTDPTLTTREQEIIRLLVDGRSNDEIGVALAITTKSSRAPWGACSIASEIVAGRAVGESGGRGLA